MRLLCVSATLLMVALQHMACAFYIPTLILLGSVRRFLSDAPENNNFDEPDTDSSTSDHHLAQELVERKKAFDNIKIEEPPQRRRALIELPLDGVLFQTVPAALIAVLGLVLTIQINNETGVQAMREQQGVYDSNDRVAVTRERGITANGIKW
eukprot:16194-Heterococcus_DN1.PRE.7